ncbi:SoxR reducing system RseC family protein [Aromatoleum sp.]|uniref:SoxR reducing system RseC family protein n=1 Tax=Aromatoleum sp. TaxID=2307007 RepID=UPI0039C89FE5
MIEIAAMVESVDGDDAWVRVGNRTGGCGRCDEPGGCRSSGIAYPFKAPTDLFRTRNGLGAKVGEVVSLRVDGRAPLRGALLGYALPVVFLLVGAALGTLFAPAGNEDFAASVGAMIGLLPGFGLSRWLVQRPGVWGGLGVEMTTASECAEEQRSRFG